MSPIRCLLLGCLISLQLCQRCSGLPIVRLFEAAALCPNPSSWTPARPERTELGCAAACTGRPDCDLFHFNLTAGLCYHGNAVCNLNAALWKEGPCVSYRAVPLPADPIAKQLDMKLIYRFATHGLMNVADPAKHRLWSGSATVLNSSGAHFVKSLNSFLMTQTPCFENLVNRGNKFSFFVRAKHPLNIDAVYAVFRHCTGNDVAHDFYTYNGSTWSQVYWPSDEVPHLYTAGRVFNVSSSVALVSTGLTHNTSHSFAFFANGSMHAAVKSPEPNEHGALSNANFQCLLLGGFPGYVNYSMVGSLHCFAISSRVLSQQEFALLDTWCQQV